jgi:hypothetical protein
VAAYVRNQPPSRIFTKEDFMTTFDIVDFIMNFESGQCTNEEIIEGFQHLIDTGLVWGLQGSYGRMAEALITKGLCHRKGAAMDIDAAMDDDRDQT